MYLERPISQRALLHAIAAPPACQTQALHSVGFDGMFVWERGLKCVLAKVLRALLGVEAVGLSPGPVCVWGFPDREAGVKRRIRKWSAGVGAALTSLSLSFPFSQGARCAARHCFTDPFPGWMAAKPWAATTPLRLGTLAPSPRRPSTTAPRGPSRSIPRPHPPPCRRATPAHTSSPSRQPHRRMSPRTRPCPRLAQLAQAGRTRRSVSSTRCRCPTA